MEKWSYDGIKLGKLDNLKEYHKKLNEGKFKYSNKREPDIKCVAFCSDEHVKTWKESRDKIEDLYADATFDAVPSDLFPPRSRKKQFFTIMTEVRRKVIILFIFLSFLYLL